MVFETQLYPDGLVMDVLDIIIQLLFFTCFGHYFYLDAPLRAASFLDELLTNIRWKVKILFSHSSVFKKYQTQIQLTDLSMYNWHIIFLNAKCKGSNKFLLIQLVHQDYPNVVFLMSHRIGLHQALSILVIDGHSIDFYSFYWNEDLILLLYTYHIHLFCQV